MRFVLALVIVAIVIAVVALRARDTPPSPSSRPPATSADTPRPADSTRVVTTAQRALLRAPSMRPARRDDSTGGAGHVGPLRVLGGTADDASLGALRVALVEIYPHLAACYEASIDVLDDPELELELEMTVEPSAQDRPAIDADVVAIPREPRPPEMIECVRAVLSSLELKSLREQLRVGYVLSFSPGP